MTAPDAPKQWQKRPEAGGRFALWLWRTLAFKVGRRLTRVITFFAALYFMLRRGPERRASREYLRRVLGRRATLLEVFRHFLCFSTVTADRVFLMADRFSRFDVQIFGLERLDAALKEGRGTLLLGAHLGSFDALRVLSLRNPNVKIRILLDQGQGAGITTMLNALNPKLAAMIIDARRPGPELVLAMQDALAQNAVVSTLADRLRPGNPAIVVNFLGDKAPFPASPWLFAAALRVPVVIAFGLYRGGNRYELHFEILTSTCHVTAGSATPHWSRWCSVSRTGSRISRAWPRTIGSISTTSGTYPLRRTMLLSALLLAATSASSQGLEGLEQRLARTPPVSTDFVEYRFSHLLKKPLREQWNARIPCRRGDGAPGHDARTRDFGSGRRTGAHHACRQAGAHAGAATGAAAARAARQLSRAARRKAHAAAAGFRGHARRGRAALDADTEAPGSGAGKASRAHRCARHGRQARLPRSAGTRWRRRTHVFQAAPAGSTPTRAELERSCRADIAPGAAAK